MIAAVLTALAGILAAKLRVDSDLRRLAAMLRVLKVHEKEVRRNRNRLEGSWLGTGQE